MGLEQDLINLTEAQIETEHARRESDARGGDWCCTVIFIGRRYEMLFWAIKEKPQGCWCGDEGTENASRKTRCPGERGCEDVVLLKTR